MDRRQFVKKSIALSLLCSVGGFMTLNLLNRKSGYYFRPPGALPENDFLTECIRCGKCIQACPYGVVKLASLKDGLHAGTPYLAFRDAPCYMCADLPCIESCPKCFE